MLCLSGFELYILYIYIYIYIYSVLPYVSYIRYVPHYRVGFLRRFGLKTGTHFAYFGLESSMVFERELRIV